MKLSIQRFIALAVTYFLMVTGSVFGTNRMSETPDQYVKYIEGISIFTNTMEDAQPQTIVYSLIKDHFTSALPQGKTEKKVLVIGYDGCRADTLRLAESSKTSAILELNDNGGETILTYAGGVNYPYLNKQATSTAPGWCSMLTGQWADVHGIKRNGQRKSNDHLTLLTTLVKDGIIDSSAFYISWDGHFSSYFTTYYPEKQYVEENGINAHFVHADDDAGTLDNVLTDLRQTDCTDFIFTTLEHTDHVGHSSGFGAWNPKYRQAFADAEKDGLEMIKTLRERETYDSEDWLILITTDHGGYNLNHGRCTIHERYTFLTSNKPIEIPAGK
ncbi:MAG: alkaline phosphatase family protein [Clostridiales bacterium]|nr:alkaline phosphatase family protein [Clostridiales bacterium]